MGEKYAPPLACTIGDLGRRGPTVAGYWLSCPDQGIEGEIVGMGWWSVPDATWWDIDILGELPTPSIPDATPCTYRHPVGIAALADVFRHSA